MATKNNVQGLFSPTSQNPIITSSWIDDCASNISNPPLNVPITTSNAIASSQTITTTSGSSTTYVNPFGNNYGSLGGISTGNTIFASYAYKPEFYCFKIPGKEDITLQSLELCENLSADGREIIKTLTIILPRDPWSNKFEVGEKFDQIHILENGEQDKLNYLYTLHNCIINGITVKEIKHVMGVIVAYTSEPNPLTISVRYDKRECSDKFKEWFKVMR